MKTLSRRRLLKLVAAGGAGAIAAPYFIPSGVLAADGKPGANDRITLGCIGVGNRGSHLIRQVPEPGRIVALCDCYVTKCNNRENWRVYQDYRKLLDQKDIDAVIVPTTDHARALICVHACLAGKDVYAEKPLTLYVQEGRVLVNAARKYRRVFQVGMQQRSTEMNRCACEFVRSGQLGKIKRVRAIYWGSPGFAGRRPEQPVPEGLDWDAWLGQAEFRPFNLDLYGGWMGCREFAGGGTTNMGTHGIDQIQFALGMDSTGPVEFWPAPPGSNNYVCFRYANGVQVDLDLHEQHGPQYGPIITGENGKVEITRNKFTTNPKDLIKNRPSQADVDKWRDETGKYQAKYHIGNWLDCIKTRQKPAADVEIGHRSVTICHLINITHWLGRKIRWDPVKEQCIGDDEANKLLVRARRKGWELPELL
jgi:predicted dehydrogenase